MYANVFIDYIILHGQSEGGILHPLISGGKKCDWQFAAVEHFLKRTSEHVKGELPKESKSYVLELLAQTLAVLQATVSFTCIHET